ncbi:MAG TPA: hypothetical protein PLE80_08175 [Opitutaceae bacterium]|nr:hypothetical protein [Opitutaceae bacterium]
MRVTDLIPGIARWQMGQPWLALLDIAAVAGLALWWWPAAVLAQLWWAWTAARDRREHVANGASLPSVQGATRQQH